VNEEQEIEGKFKLEEIMIKTLAMSVTGVVPHALAQHLQEL
jgi:hypothetical protein